MNTALIFAGGTGERMNSNAMPKQFLRVHEKPVIIYTLEHFENHDDIDNICVVYPTGWVNSLKKMLKLYEITKVKWLVKGGGTVQESIFNGLSEIHATLFSQKGTIVLIHDGVRPLIDGELITKCIDSVKTHGSAVTIAPVSETIVNTNQNGEIETIEDIKDRSLHKFARAPQCFFLEDIYTAHKKSKENGMKGVLDSATLMQQNGHTLFTVNGPAKNIKITTPIDYYIFKALLNAQENAQIFGI
ncbi:MAG: 2-C-methyl-D-erythritol 4-phosphate cytidylyltransferase [Fibromonadaceae bacterium]|jgi:2-C-methyl-D-erythritol 4-phosphate cytidylyltransferase|nr:2-C-methyl-D-erythritol 4-phosphate cytidylyltransferase [Fibromonadaceae bacterium]